MERTTLLFILFIALVPALSAQPAYDLLLKGGHVIDPKNSIDKVMDVAVAGGKIARVAANIPSSEAGRTVDATGLYVTPGLIDLHAHVYTRADVKALVAGENNVQPDAFSFRSGVTTMVDAGTSGWRNFPNFRERIVDRSKTRVLALYEHRRLRHGHWQGKRGGGTRCGCSRPQKKSLSESWAHECLRHWRRSEPIEKHLNCKDSEV